jgi:hypothetical protein
MNIAEIPLLTVPLELKAHELARQLAAVQSTVQKGKRVYLNALAVYAVYRCDLRSKLNRRAILLPN